MLLQSLDLDMMINHMTCTQSLYPLLADTSRNLMIVINVIYTNFIYIHKDRHRK